MQSDSRLGDPRVLEVVGVAFDVRLIVGTGPSVGGLYAVHIGQNGEQRRVVFGPEKSLGLPTLRRHTRCGRPAMPPRGGA